MTIKTGVVLKVDDLLVLLSEVVTTLLLLEELPPGLSFSTNFGDAVGCRTNP